jgi:aquaporin Z
MTTSLGNTEYAGSAVSGVLADGAEFVGDHVDDLNYGGGRPLGGMFRGPGGGPFRYSELARAAAEALGTFILVLSIMLALMFTVLSGNSWLVVALTVGLALTAAMAAVGHVSGGGDFNPAVTIAKAIAGRTAWREVPAFIAAQIVGAAAAAFVVWALIPESFAQALQFGSRGEFIGTTAQGFGALSPLAQASGGQTEFGWGAALLAEILFTALFVAVVLGATRRRNRHSGLAPLVVGLSFAAFWLMTWPITRGGLNPVRALASVLFAGDRALWGQLWLFIVGPLIGAVLAGLFYRAFQPVGRQVVDRIETGTREVLAGVPTPVVGGWTADSVVTPVDFEAGDPVVVVDDNLGDTEAIFETDPTV